MQHCTGIIISKPSLSLILSSVLSVICVVIETILWTVSDICGTFGDLICSMKLKLLNKKHQMYGYLHCLNLRKGFLMRKYLNYQKNFRWHFNQSVCGVTTMTKNIPINTAVTMSGKL